MLTPKPDYKKLIDEAYREWEDTQTTPMTLPVPPAAADDLTRRIMKKVEEAGLIVTMDDGTDYAHRSR